MNFRLFSSCTLGIKSTVPTGTSLPVYSSSYDRSFFINTATGHVFKGDSVGGSWVDGGTIDSVRAIQVSAITVTDAVHLTRVDQAKYLYLVLNDNTGIYRYKIVGSITPNTTTGFIGGENYNTDPYYNILLEYDDINLSDVDYTTLAGKISQASYYLTAIPIPSSITGSDQNFTSYITSPDLAGGTFPMKALYGVINSNSIKTLTGNSSTDLIGKTIDSALNILKLGGANVVIGTPTTLNDKHILRYDVGSGNWINTLADATQSVSGFLSAGDKAKLDGATSDYNNVGGTLVKRDDNGRFSVADPGSSASHVATKGYVDGIAQGLRTKSSVRFATTVTFGNISNLQTQTLAVTNLDGFTGNLSENDRILVMNQTNSYENGIYIAHATGGWVRSSDMDIKSETFSSYVFVNEGTANIYKGFVCAASDSDSGTLWLPGQTGGTYMAMPFNTFSSAGNYTAGNGIDITTNAISVKLDGTTLSESGNGLKISRGSTSGQPLIAAGSSTDPSFGALDLTNTNAVTGALPISKGGTGQTALSNGIMQVSAGVVGITNGTSGQILQMSGSSPSWSTVPVSKIYSTTGSNITINFADMLDMVTATPAPYAANIKVISGHYSISNFYSTYHCIFDFTISCQSNVAANYFIDGDIIKNVVTLGSANKDASVTVSGSTATITCTGLTSDKWTACVTLVHVGA